MCFVSRIIDPLTRDVPIIRKQVNPYAVNTRDENVQKQPSRGVLKKRCSENMQQIFENMQHLRKCDVLPTINPFHATGIFRYPLKTSENLWFSDVFRGYQKMPVA